LDEKLKTWESKAKLKSQKSGKQNKRKQKKMKESLVLLFVLMTSISVGQNKYQDDIYFKKESVIEKTNIDSLTTLSVEENSENFNDSKSKQSKLIGIVEMGFLQGIGSNSDRLSKDELKLNIILGYKINPYFSLGLGTGLRYFLVEQGTLVPLFADFRTNLLDKKVSPYLSLGVGYTFNLKNNFEGVAFLLNPNVGVNIKTSDKHTFNLGIGYEMHLMDKYSSYYEESGTISIVIGVQF